MRKIAPCLGLAVAGLLALSSPAPAQSQNNGWGGALDQLNRAVNPDAYPQDRNAQDRGAQDRGATRDDRRYEGSSNDRSANAGPYRRYSDRDLRDQYDRLVDEQRQMQRDRRAMEEEMERRGLRR
ncbi:hypothetical protein [Azospirillum agricola]|uniref:hypothetical protein n=1 Tax=Azospirillum agricola TaxID=1720247 RepID=UPI000A0F2D69|nr:hypothetical protein [Azospirillum agricola]SMH62371.1 hypothetical protein SAMN02982994_6247 [Azospirillum lipoferum]